MLDTTVRMLQWIGWTFDEILYVLMNGTGVGFSVERQFTQKLPVVAEEFFHSDTMITVADSKLGWAKAFKELLGMLYIGQIPRWDLSKVRPVGSHSKHLVVVHLGQNH